MILADADAGRGIVLIDPKGDLVTDVLSRLPARPAIELCCSTPTANPDRRA